MDKDAIIKNIWEEIATVEDPDLKMSLVELGLIYGVEVSDDLNVQIKMTLTSMACPIGPFLRDSIEAAARKAEGVKDVKVNIVWSPQWDPREMATEEAQMNLGII
jgi:metal-sulfur cluster biosynthetic enzyme